VAVLAFDVAVFRRAVHVSSKLNASRMLVTEKVFGFLLAALDVRADEIEAALMDSVREAVAWLERHATCTRNGHHSSRTGEWRDGPSPCLSHRMTPGAWVDRPQRVIFARFCP
jgi:hypothetical protein